MLNDDLFSYEKQIDEGTGDEYEQMTINVKTCKYCDSPVKAKGMCSKHYARVRNHGDPDFVKMNGNRSNKCGICKQPALALNLCRKHYDLRWRNIRKNKGLCIDCGLKLDRDGSRCSVCLKMHNLKIQSRKVGH